MQRIANPKQTRLFDPFDNVLTEKTRKRLLDSWAGNCVLCLTIYISACNA